MVVGRPEQLAALTSPVRLELLEQFGLREPCAVADVALRMERTPDSLYYHVRKLVEVGLLEPVDRRRAAHRFEVVYRLPADELEIPRKASSGRARRLTTKAIDTVLRLAGRELEAALDDEDARDEGAARTFYGRRLKARLPKTALRELNRHLTAIEEIFSDAAGKRPRAARTVAVTIVMTPVPRREER